MTRSREQHLLGTLLALLAARGLGAEALDPWRAWVAFTFVDAVEQHRDFADLVTDRAVDADVRSEAP